MGGYFGTNLSKEDPELRVCLARRKWLPLLEGLGEELPCRLRRWRPFPCVPGLPTWPEQQPAYSCLRVSEVAHLPRSRAVSRGGFPIVPKSSRCGCLALLQHRQPRAKIHRRIWSNPLYQLNTFVPTVPPSQYSAHPSRITFLIMVLNPADPRALQAPSESAAATFPPAPLGYSM